VLGEQGSYMVRLGQLIHKIKGHSLQQGRPCFFVAENVPMDKFEDKQAVDAAFRVAPVVLDSKYFSPCKRNRIYFTSVRGDTHILPSALFEVDDDGKLPHFLLLVLLQITVTRVAWDSPQADSDAMYDNGWHHPGKYCDSNEEMRKKANTFMASSSR
jgi:hypothetical protein